MSLMANCPICNQLYPQNLIEKHVNDCLDQPSTLPTIPTTLPSHQSAPLFQQPSSKGKGKMSEEELQYYLLMKQVLTYSLFFQPPCNLEKRVRKEDFPMKKKTPMSYFIVKIPIHIHHCIHKNHRIFLPMKNLLANFKKKNLVFNPLLPQSVIYRVISAIHPFRWMKFYSWINALINFARIASKTPFLDTVNCTIASKTSNVCCVIP